MDSAATLARLPDAAAPAGPVPNADFEVRWAAWVARGRVHEQRVRRRFLIWAPILAVAAALAFAFFSS